MKALYGYWLVGCAFAGNCLIANAQESDPLQIQPTQVVAPPFGRPFAVEIHREWMFLASAYNSVGGTQYDVHVYNLTSDGCTNAPCWRWHSLLPRSSSAVWGTPFGISMEFDGRSLLVGDPNATGGMVVVYELQEEQFVIEQELTLNGTEPRFGATLALDGNQLAVGAVNWDTTSAIYMFERTGGEWQYTQRVATQDAEMQQFGYSIDLRGAQMIAGANEGGYAVIFRRKAGIWQEQQRLTSPGTSSFGIGAEIAGRNAFVSAVGDAPISQLLRDGGDWYLADVLQMPVDSTSFPPYTPGGPLQLQGGDRLFAGGVGGVHLFELTGGEWSRTTQFVTPTKVDASSEEIMDVHRRWLAVIDSNLIYVFDLRSLP